MSSLQKILSISRYFRTLGSRINSSKLNQNCINHNNQITNLNAALNIVSANFHSSSPRYDLMEFFDVEKNWGENEIRHGRAWSLDELRIKSNTDLHKLWYILLKEKNMLKTVEHECDVQYKLFPSPERLDKVEESMSNLETVVRERNRAYYLLETGEDGERPYEIKENLIGLEEFYGMTEHTEPLKETPKPIIHGKDVRNFKILLREQEILARNRAANLNRSNLKKLLSRFPNTDRKLLKKQYPDVDIDKIDRNDLAPGHYQPKVD